MEEMQNSAPKRTLSRFRKPSEPVNEVAFDAPPRAPERPEIIYCKDCYQKEIY